MNELKCNYIINACFWLNGLISLTTYTPYSWAKSLRALYQCLFCLMLLWRKLLAFVSLSSCYFLQKPLPQKDTGVKVVKYIWGIKKKEKEKKKNFFFQCFFWVGPETKWGGLGLPRPPHGYAPAVSVLNASLPDDLTGSIPLTQDPAIYRSTDATL